MSLRLLSDAFGDGGQLPERYRRSGGNVPPPLDWDGVPPGAAELVLLVEDLDAVDRQGRPLLHWVLTGLPADLDGIGEGEEPEQARPGRNSFGRSGYDGPEPRAGESHRYRFSVVAVSSPVDPGQGGGAGADPRAELDARALDRAELVCHC